MIPKNKREGNRQRIRDAIVKHWRTSTDKELAELLEVHVNTIRNHRKALENEGLVLPRFDNCDPRHTMLIREVTISAIRPAPENDLLYDPVQHDDPEFVALVDDIHRNGLINPPGVSADGYVFDGHRRLAAAERLGMERITIRIAPTVSRAKNRDAFVKLLKACNTQRVKTTAEMLREEIVGMEDSTIHALHNYREGVAEVDGVEVYTLPPRKARAEIVQKRELANASCRIVKKRHRDGLGTTDRKAFYLLLNELGLVRNDVSRTPFENNDACYKDVTNLLTRLRLTGEIPFDAITDETRPCIQWDAHRSVGSFIRRELDGLFCRYSRDLIQSQPNWVELLVEKNTVAMNLKRLAAKYRLPMTSGRGYSSLPPRKAMVDRFRASGREKLVIVAVADFDPEGQDIPRSFGCSLRDDFGVPDDKLRIVKAALTHRQTQELELHEGQFAKTTGSRYKAFVEAYGKRCWELEAVDDGALEDIIEDTIRSVLDVDQFDQELAIEEREQTELDQVRDQARETLLDLLGGAA